MKNEIETLKMRLLEAERAAAEATDRYYAASGAEEAEAEAAMDAAEEVARDARVDYAAVSPESIARAEECRLMERASARRDMEID